MDSPAHFIPNGLLIHQVPLQSMLVYAAVIDVSSKCDPIDSPNYELSIEDVLEWEATHGRIPQKSCVIMRCGYDNRMSSVEEYAGLGHHGRKANFPGFSIECARFLTAERDIVGIGLDTLTPDCGVTISTMKSHDDVVVH